MAHAHDFNLKRGQRIKAQVEEILTPTSVIVSFQGKLVRVANSTDRKIQVGEILDLQVLGIHPLEFRFFQKSSSFERLV